MCYGFTVTIEPAPLVKYVHSLLTTDRGLYVFLSAFFSFDKKNEWFANVRTNGKTRH